MVLNMKLQFPDRAGITKVYEAVTQYCGFSAIGWCNYGLISYGKENKNRFI